MKDFVSPLIAVVAVVFAAFQWFNAREKLRFDLYNRRFEVYSLTIDFVQILMEWQSTPAEDRRRLHKAFIKVVRESQFLFASDPSILKLLDEMNTKAFVIKGFIEEIAPQAKSFGPDFKKYYDDEQAALQWVMAAVEPLETKLTPFLAFGQKRFSPLKPSPLQLPKES